jgi:glycosyltransferase involved in cell wall biosynthesis
MENQAPRKMNILFVARDDGGCGFYRCEQPSKFLMRSGLAVSKHVLMNPTNEDLIAADLVVMQNVATLEASNMIRFLEANKIPFMTEFDDFVQHVSPRNVAGYGMWNPSSLYIHRAMEMSTKAAGMTVSTPQLAREYFPYNPYVYVLPNYLDKDKWDLPIVRRQDDKIRIGWCGGNAHADDLRMVAGVLNKLVKEYDGKVIFETMGMTRQELGGVFPMTPTPHESCPSCGFEGSLHHFPGETYDNYPQALASHGWDIAIAPVINNAFGSCKSDLKLKEYSALGYPVVASRVVPYNEAQKLGSSVVLADGFNEWYEALKGLIDDKERRSELARAGKDWAEKNWLQDHIHEFFEVYKETALRYTQVVGARP